MARIVESTEDHGLERIPPLGTKPRTQGGAITLAAAEVADFVDAKYLCVFTESGDSARRMSRLRFRIPMIGVHARPGDPPPHGADLGHPVVPRRARHAHRPMFVQVDDVLPRATASPKVGDKVVVISGSPPGIIGSTNDIRVHVGDAVTQRRSERDSD